MYNIKYIEHPMHLIAHRSRTFHKTKAILLQIVLNHQYYIYYLR